MESRLAQRQRLIRKLDEDLKVAADCAARFRKEIEDTLAARLERKKKRARRPVKKTEAL